MRENSEDADEADTALLNSKPCNGNMGSRDGNNESLRERFDEVLIRPTEDEQALHDTQRGNKLKTQI